MSRWTIRAIDKWDQPETTERQRTPFKASWSVTLALLDRELAMLDAENVVLMRDVRTQDVRLDGELRERANPRSPKVVLSFDSQHGPLRYACDRFTSWEANLRAIALGLEALRKVERFGIAQRGEQYTGWAQLGSGIVTGQSLTRAEAVTIMLDLTMLNVDGQNQAAYSSSDLDDDGAPGPFLDDAYRAGARTHHPDRGGNAAAFAALTQAYEVLNT